MFILKIQVRGEGQRRKKRSEEKPVILLVFSKRFKALVVIMHLLPRIHITVVKAKYF